MKNFDIISLDVWDTVLNRKCHPDEVKVYTSEYLMERYSHLLKRRNLSAFELFKLRQNVEANIGYENVSNGFDDEYRIQDVIERWLGELLVSDVDDIANIVGEVVNEEFSQEKRISFLNDRILDVVSKYSYSKLIFISDFYMSSAMLSELLSHHQWPLNYDRIFSSCDVMLNKRSGRLFDYVQKSLLLMPGQTHLHIGDNEYSDYEVPTAKGLEAYWFCPKDDVIRRNNINKAFNSEGKNNYDFYDVFRMEFELNGSIADDNGPYEFGRQIGYLFNSFVLLILEQARNLGVDRVFYFTREGQFFKTIHDCIVDISGGMYQSAKSELLEVSRLSTFGPSIKNLNIQELMRLWNQYSIQSARIFLASIDIEPQSVSHILKRYDIEIDSKQYLFNDPSFKQLIEDKEFQDIVGNVLSCRRENLLRYLSDKGLLKEKRALVVDIGWRGTIQDNLAYLCPDIEFTGIYLGLLGYLSQQPLNSRKISCGPNLNITKEDGYLLDVQTPLEMLCNGLGGSVVGYKAGTSGEVNAIREEFADEDSVYENFTKDFQRGVVDITPSFMEFVTGRGLQSSDIRQSALNIWREFISFPNRGMVSAYFSLVHNERFGTGVLDVKDKNFDMSLLLKAFISKEAKKELVQKAMRTGWPQAYILANMPFLLRFFNRAVRRRWAEQSV